MRNFESTKWGLIYHMQFQQLYSYRSIQLFYYTIVSVTQWGYSVTILHRYMHGVNQMMAVKQMQWCWILLRKSIQLLATILWTLAWAVLLEQMMDSTVVTCMGELELLQIYVFMFMVSSNCSKLLDIAQWTHNVSIISRCTMSPPTLPQCGHMWG